MEATVASNCCLDTCGSNENTSDGVTAFFMNDRLNSTMSWSAFTSGSTLDSHDLPRNCGMSWLGSGLKCDTSSGRKITESPPAFSW